jgi:outer membrane protein TolC
MKEAEAILEKEKGIYAVNLNAGVSYSGHSSQSLSVQMPGGEKILTYSAGLSSRLFTGGDLSLSLTSSRFDLYFPSYGGPIYEPFFRPLYNPYYYPELVLSYSQPLLNGLLGLPRERRIEAAAFQAKQAREILKQAVLDKALEIRKKWYALYLAGIALKAWQNRTKDLDSSYSSMKAAGRGESDLLFAKAALISASAGAGLLEKEYSEARELFLSAAGYEPAAWESVVAEPGEETDEVYVPGEMTKDLEDALVSLQPQVAAAKFGALSAASLRSAESFAWLPSLNLTGAAGFNGTGANPDCAFIDLGKGKTGGLMAGLMFSWDVFGGAGPGSAAAAKERENAALAVLQQAEDGARIRIRSSYKGISAEKKSYDAQKEARTLMEKRVQLLKQAGAGAELIRAHGDRFDARKAEAGAFASYAVSVAEWNSINGKYDYYYNEFIADSLKAINHDP